MEEKTNTVSFVAFESMKATMERTIKRLWILAIILVLLLFGSNAAWIYYENSFTDEITETYTADTGNGNGIAVASREGNVNTYGTSDIHPNEETNP